MAPLKPPPPPSVVERPRYERKFVITEAAAAPVEMVIRAHPAHFREVYPPRIVQNMYYDTPVLSDFWKHINGAEKRSKLRVRWYGPDGAGVRRPVLELKAKQGAVGWKAAVRLREPTGDGSFEFRGAADQLLLDQDRHGMVERLRRRVPVLWNRYSRRYFRSADGRLRLTLDHDLAVQAAEGHSLGLRRSHADPNLMILELKYDAVPTGPDERAPRNWPFRLTRMSKYVYGIQKLRGFEG